MKKYCDIEKGIRKREFILMFDECEIFKASSSIREDRSTFTEGPMVLIDVFPVIQC